MTPQYIWLDGNGKETKRQDKGRGRPRNDAERREDGNWYIVEGAAPVAKATAPRATAATPARPTGSIFTIFLQNGKEVKREPKGRGRPWAGAVKRDDGNWYVEQAVGAQVVRVGDKPLPANPRAVKGKPVGAGKVIPVALAGAAIIAPAGKCPVKLTGTDFDTVRQWAGAIVAHYAGNGQKIAQSGVEYFVREFYPYGTPRHQAVIAFLQPPAPAPVVDEVPLHDAA